MVKRCAALERNTKETQIRMALEIPESGAGGLQGTSGIGFFDHMLNSFGVHGRFRISLEMSGDLLVDGHHSIEDTGIVLGRLFGEILTDKTGLARFGESYVPMDEALAFAAVDISGRPYLVYDAPQAEFQSVPMLGAYDVQMTKEFFRALANGAGMTLHLRVLYGENVHHMTEAVFKAAARAIAQAGALTGSDLRSTKGVL